MKIVRIKYCLLFERIRKNISFFFEKNLSEKYNYLYIVIYGFMMTIIMIVIIFLFNSSAYVVIKLPMFRATFWVYFWMFKNH